MGPLDGMKDFGAIDWNGLGLKVGLEIHRQMKGSKLFCDCSTDLNEDDHFIVERELHLKRSEIGEEDAAAVQEAVRKRVSRYQVPGTVCLVELDEEPPHIPSRDTLLKALTIVELFRCRPVDEIIFMRKLVLDGSNTAGFQRTGLFGLGGGVRNSSGSEIGITSICLEEDSARKMEDLQDGTVYRLDRLGTPEIEITTDPDIHDPEEAVEVARRIGELLRDTGFVKRGIGTIRQDVNISIDGGSRTEIKLVQDLPLISKVIKKEVIRQLLLMEVAKVLKERGIGPTSLPFKLFDLTDQFRNCSSKVIQGGLRAGGLVLGIRLTGFTGLMGERWKDHSSDGIPSGKVRKDIDDSRRLGPEFAQYAKIMAGVKGIFHSDELPDYGITKEEVEKVHSAMEIDKSKEAFVLICGPEETAKKALRAVHERALVALEGVPSEVRRPLPDGRSEYMRPMPGAARMYPETDIPPIPVGPDLIMEAYNRLPMGRDAMIAQLALRNTLSKETVLQIYNLDLIEDFNELNDRINDPKIASVFLLQSFPRAFEKGLDPLSLDIETLAGICKGALDGKISKEAFPKVLISLLEAKRSGMDESEALRSVIPATSGIKDIESSVRDLSRKIIDERSGFVKEKGLSALGPLMGPLMKEFRGKIDGSRISEILREEVERFLGGIS